MERERGMEGGRERASDDGSKDGQRERERAGGPGGVLRGPADVPLSSARRESWGKRQGTSAANDSLTETRGSLNTHHKLQHGPGTACLGGRR